MTQTEQENQIVMKALKIIESRMATGEAMTSSDATKTLLKLHLGLREQEVFCVVYLNNQHQVISLEDMFFGTIDGAAVYPREIVKRALQLNAAAVIFAHNHPSGSAEPSHADIAITLRLKAALATVDIRVLDHIIVGGANIVSLSERGNI